MPGINDRHAKLARYALQNEDMAQIQFSRAFDKAMTAFTIADNDVIGSIDTIGDSGLPANFQPVESAWYIPGPTALIDVYTPAPNTTGTLVVDDVNHVIAACDTPGDSDWFKVTLTAGVTYEFGQFAYVGGIPGAEGNGIALADAYLEIRDSTGNIVLSYADGGGPNTPSGLDALLTFQATYTGDYYVNATSFDNDGDGVGDFAGDYEIFAKTATGTVYTTEYDISSPLHSIDWGGVLVNREHVSVRNPDGMEGPRPTGQSAADPADVEGNALGFPGKNVIYLYFAGEGDLYANADSTIPAQVVIQNPYQYEIQAMLTAANEFSKVADVVFVSNYILNTTTGLYERDPTVEYKPGPLGPEAGVKYAAGVDDGFDADFFYFSYPGTPGPGISLLGSMNPPDNGDEGVAQFNSADERWNAQMLQPGGFSFVTLIHEFGHGMGLAHPHDTGGGSSIMQGVEPGPVLGDDGGAGAFDLNQGVNTMMSYNDGWEKSPYGQPETTNEGYGWLSSLMALDIAVIQDKYGVNEDWATGNDTYVLKDANEWGVYIDAATGQPAVHDATNQATARDGYYQGESTSYSSIWDAGGIDQITYSGAKDTNIDLRAATLRYEHGGAGWMSYATGIYGGFTIANGVTIENATGGSGNDTIIGNEIANVLNGGAGADLLRGGGGDDIYFADNIGDSVVEAVGQGFDQVYSSANHVLTAGSSVEVLGVINTGSTAALSLTGNALGQQIFGNAGANMLTGGGGQDALYGGLGDDTYFVEGDDHLVEVAGAGFDQAYSSTGITLTQGAAIEVLSVNDYASTNALTIIGNELAQQIFGNAGANILVGGGGQDALYGNNGDDIYLIDGDDFLTEAAGNGFDQAYSSTNITLTAGAAIEVLGAANSSSTVALNINGNALGQQIFGNAGANVLSGGGGVDALYGRGGADAFLFASSPAGGSFVFLGDFNAADDTILLDHNAFSGLTAGALNPNAFVTGTAAQDSNDRIIYDSASGALYYDADGSGAGAAIHFATLNGAPAITAGDFTVI